MTPAYGYSLQAVRVVDVLLLGPFMVWFGLGDKHMPDWARAVLVLSGLATIWFNAANYTMVRRLDT